MKQRLFALVLAGLALGGCQKMEAGEYGVVFSALPPWMGGGVRSSVIQPGEMGIVMPWERVYKVDTTRQSLGWGARGEGRSRDEVEDYVQTRALDGNEVLLSIRIQFRVDEKRVRDVIRSIGPDRERVENLVATLARADIRTHMNILRTQDFFKPERRQAAVEQLREALSARLNPEGIEITDVLYDHQEFARRLSSGAVDNSYQKLINDTQSLVQETEQEKRKIATVEQQKQQEYNEAQARVNRIVQQAEGFKAQASLRGDAALAAKTNEAEQTLAVGTAQVEGVRKQVEALKGPGGRALLRLEIAKQLLASNPRFVVLNSAGGGGKIDFNRVDANDILRQAGIFVTAPEMEREKKKVEESNPQGEKK